MYTQSKQWSVWGVLSSTCLELGSSPADSALERGAHAGVPSSHVREQSGAVDNMAFCCRARRLAGHWRPA